MCHLCNLEGGKSGSWKPVTITSSWKPVTVTSILLVLLKFYYEQRPSFLPCLELTRALTHIHDAYTHDFSHYAAFLLFLLNLSNKITAGMLDWLLIFFFFFSISYASLKPVLKWANVCSPEHTLDTSTNYDSFLNWTFSSPNMVRTVQTLLHSQLACNEMQASARTCGRRAADSMIENVG